MSKFLNISTDNTLGGSSASDETVSSQKAVKDYVDAHSGGGSSLFIAIYNSTSYSDIVSAHNAGKQVICSYTGIIYYLRYVSASEAIFFSANRTGIYMAYVTSSNVWDSENTDIPTVTSTYSATGTDAVNGTAVASAISGKANNSDVVKLTGDQVISGVKNFGNSSNSYTLTINGKSNDETSHAAIMLHVPHKRYSLLKVQGDTQGIQIRIGNDSDYDSLYCKTESTSDNSNKVATTAYVKSNLSSKQDTLVSGTNIKTVNGNSVLGSGDLTVDSGSSRNIGEIVASTIPLTDAGLHLLDGGVIQRGSYADFVDYIAGLYNADPTANYFAQPHGEIDWVQPIATASTTAIDGGDMVITTSNEHSNYLAWRAMDGIKSGTVASSGWGTNNTSATQWWQLKLPYQIRIFGLKGYQRYDTTPANANTIGRFYTSSDMTTPIGDTYTNASGINWNEVEVSGIPSTGIVTDTIYFQKTGGGSYGGLGELEITATVVGTERTAEQVWQEIVDEYGVCGKFVYNSTNNTVRLPKISGFTEGTIDPTVLSNITEAGLPNITGKFNATGLDWASNGTSGAFHFDTSGGNNNVVSGSTGNKLAGFDASRSNSIYGNSDTVQPQSIKVLYYIVIATSTKTDIQVDIDEIATDLNGKADVDLSNVSNTAGFRKLVEVYNNGSSWYKVFREYNPSDGTLIGLWCEQGGRETDISSSKTVTLLKAMSDNTYTILLGQNGRATGQDGTNVFFFNQTSNDFKLGNKQYGTSGQLRNCYWQACGYIS